MEAVRGPSGETLDFLNLPLRDPIGMVNRTALYVIDMQLVAL
jgi:hypothetical protein